MHDDRETCMLAGRLEALGLGAVSPGDFRRFGGGYSNSVWLVRMADGRRLVAKHYARDHERNNDYFPNCPADEAEALRRLGPAGLAPSLSAFEPESAEHRALLVYGYAEGPLWQDGTPAVADLLGRVHAVPLPPAFRRVPASAQAVVAHGERMNARGPRSNARLDALKPRMAGNDEPPLALIHTDCGPGNIVVTGAGLVLIDWQCPAAGDAAEDIACFLSPAMMALYRRAPHGADAAAAFLDAYRDGGAVARYRAKAAAFHWRIACYCHYRAQELEAAEPETSARYRLALARELDFIEGLPG